MGVDYGLLSNTSASVKKLAGHVGFKVLLAWHYIVLFTPLLAGNEWLRIADFVFERQLTLYLALALTFLALTFFGRSLARVSRSFPALLLYGGAGTLSVLATSATIVVSVVHGVPLATRLIAIAAMGCCEALLIHLWIHHYLKSRGTKDRRALVIDMIAGVAIAFLVMSLEQPLSLIIVAILPGIAAFSLLAIQSSGSSQPSVPQSTVPKQLESVLLARFVKNHLPSVVFAFTFGLMQGSLIELKLVYFMVPVPVVLLGIILAGVVIFLLRGKSSSYEDIDTMHRYALLLLVCGVLGLSFFKQTNLEYVSEAALLAGFNLFDYGALVLSMSLVRRAGLNKAHFIDSGRSLVYLGFALGLTSGFTGCRLMSDSYNDALVYTMGGIAIVLLVITMLMRLDKKGPLEPAWVEGPGSNLSAQDAAGAETGHCYTMAEDTAYTEGSWQEACIRAAKTYQLSPRETEVFMLLGRGRNAEYIQGKLVISLHTAKSHIANIYQKLGVHSIQEMLDLIELFVTR